MSRQQEQPSEEVVFSSKGKEYKVSRDIARLIDDFATASQQDLFHDVDKQDELTEGEMLYFCLPDGSPDELIANAVCIKVQANLLGLIGSIRRWLFLGDEKSRHNAIDEYKKIEEILQYEERVRHLPAGSRVQLLSEIFCNLGISDLRGLFCDEVMSLQREVKDKVTAIIHYICLQDTAKNIALGDQLGALLRPIMESEGIVTSEELDGE
jgi:hypothetical protein